MEAEVLTEDVKDILNLQRRYWELTNLVVKQMSEVHRKRVSFEVAAERIKASEQNTALSSAWEDVKQRLQSIVQNPDIEIEPSKTSLGAKLPQRLAIRDVCPTVWPTPADPERDAPTDPLSVLFVTLSKCAQMVGLFRLLLKCAVERAEGASKPEDSAAKLVQRTGASYLRAVDLLGDLRTAQVLFEYGARGDLCWEDTWEDIMRLCKESWRISAETVSALIDARARKLEDGWVHLRPGSPLPDWPELKGRPIDRSFHLDVASPTGEEAVGSDEEIRKAQREAQRFVDGFLNSNAPATKKDDKPAPDLPGNIFRRNGDTWQVRFGSGKAYGLKDSVGMRYIHVLLRKRGSSCNAKDLVLGDAARLAIQPSRNVTRDNPYNESADEATGTAGAKVRAEPIDKRLDMREIRKRVEELRRLLREAKETGDYAAEEACNREMKSIGDQTRRDTTKHGRVRELNPEIEKYRKSASNAIQAAIGNIGRHDRSFGEHLRKHVKCGKELYYMADIFWTTEDA